MSTVQEIIDAAQQRTADAINQANYFVRQLESVAGAWTTYNYQDTLHTLVHNPQVSTGVPVDGAKSAANIDQSTAQNTKATAVAIFPGEVAQGGIDNQSIQEFTDTPVTPDIPNKPTFVNPGAPSGDVNLTDVNVSLGQKPEAVTSTTHEEVAIPDPTAIDIGSYTIPNPEVDYLVPTNNFSFVETEYSSPFRDTILAVLADDIANGGSGINPDDEQALFERGRDREAATYKNTANEIARNYAARGFKMPPSVVAKLMDKARDGFNKAMSGLNRDIMLQRSDLHVKARQFAIQAGTTLDNAMLNYHGSVMERALNVAKFTAQFGIEYHNLQVQAFQDRLNTWIKVSDVKTQWVDNAIKATKEYELKLAKLELTDKRNRTRTELMNAMNRAVEVAENIRESELKIGSFQLENNKLRIEQSKLLTQNYAEVMRGNETAFRAYAEAVKAENLRNEPFRLKLEAHKEQRATALSKVDIQVKQKETEIRAMAANLQRAETALQAYYKELDNAVNVATHKAKQVGIDLEAWKMLLDVEKTNAANSIETGKINLAGKLDTIKTNLQGHDSVNKNWIDLHTLRASAAKSGIGLYENLIMGAQSALGTIATLSETSA